MTEYFDSNRNFTIAYSQEPRPYHTKIAELIRERADKPLSVLDVGCGVGNTLVELARLGGEFRATVADIDPECVRITKQRIDPERAIVLASADEIYDVEDRFDVVVLSHVLQYDKDPARLVRHLLDRLAPEGFLVLAIPNLVTPARFAAYVRGRAQTEGVYYWDRRAIERFLTEIVGATEVEVHGDYVPLPGENRASSLTAAGSRLARRFPMLTFSTICVASP